jgi:hypothetical protein
MVRKTIKNGEKNHQKWREKQSKMVRKTIKNGEKNHQKW